MSVDLESRLRQGFHGTVETFEFDAVDTSAAFVKVMENVQRRQRRQIFMALAAAGAAALAIVTGPRLSELSLSFDPPNPRPAQEGNTEESKEDIRENTRKVLEGLREAKIPKSIDDSGKGSGRVAITGVASDAAGTPGSGRSSGSGRVVAAPVADDREAEPAEPAERRTPRPAEPAGHTEAKDYNGSSLPAAGGFSGCDEGANAQGVACVGFQAREGERFVEISVDDMTGSDVSAAVQIDRDGNGDIDGEWTFICSETTRPIPIPDTGKAIVWVEIERGNCDDGRQSSPVRGSVTAVFSS